MQRTAGFLGIWFGEEGGVHFMKNRRLTKSSLEEENLIGEIQRVAVFEINLQLRRTHFLRQRINLNFLRFAVFIDVENKWLEVIHCVDAVRLSHVFSPA